MNFEVHGKPVEIVLSFDDGKKDDMHLVELLRQYDMPATFYIPSANRELTDDQIRDLAETFTIGGHTKNHRFLTSIPLPDAESEICDGKSELEAIIGEKITTFCYPRGRFSPVIKDMVKAAGFTEARTTRVLATKRAYDPYELDTTIHFYQRKEYAGRPWLSLALEFFDQTINPDSDVDYFHGWGHGYEIIRDGGMKDFEFLLSYMSDKLHDKSI